jgi:formylmethanofuran dehydrogenase subunit B
MSKYRINVRFDTDDPKQAEAVKFLQSLEHSRNAFIVSAVLNAVSGKSTANNVSLEEIRRIIREELQEVSFVAAPSAFQPVKTELTEEEQAKNEKSVLDDLEMFG